MLSTVLYSLVILALTNEICIENKQKEKDITHLCQKTFDVTSRLIFLQGELQEVDCLGISFEGWLCVAVALIVVSFLVDGITSSFASNLNVVKINFVSKVNFNLQRFNAQTHFEK